MIATPFVANTFPLDIGSLEFVGRHRVQKTGAELSSLVGQTEHIVLGDSGPSSAGGRTEHIIFGDSGSSAGQNEHILPIVDETLFADSIVLDNGVTLQLYAAYDAADQFVGLRVRYRRIGGAGFTDTDVMLEPAQHTVK